MFEEGLYSLLSGTTAITALIGARIYPVSGPPDNPTYPYLTYAAMPGGEGSSYTFDGKESQSRRIQFDIWGLAFLDGKNVALALRNLLSGLNNFALNDGTVVLIAERLNEMPNFDVVQRTYRSVCEYEFLISEP